MISAELLTDAHIQSQNTIHGSIYLPPVWGMMGGVQQRMMIAHQHIQCWCQTEDCYSAQRSGGSRLKEQPGPGAWSLVCVCVRVWVHTKPIETPAGYHCQPLIKREKECIGLWHIWLPGKRAGLFGRIFSHPFLFGVNFSSTSLLAS